MMVLELLFKPFIFPISIFVTVDYSNIIRCLFMQMISDQTNCLLTVQ